MPSRCPRRRADRAFCLWSRIRSTTASAGCLDVPGLKIPTSDLRNSHRLLARRAFHEGRFRQVSEEEYAPSFFRAPIVGLWAFKYISMGNLADFGIPDGAPIDNGTTGWFADGNEITFSGISNPIVGATCIGVWRQTGEHTYVLNHIGLSWNPLAASPSLPRAPPIRAADPALPAVRRSSSSTVTLSKDGQSYTGHFAITQLMPDGKTPAAPKPITGMISATRITVDTDTFEP